MLTPLAQIPDKYAGDPQEGLKEVCRHLDTAKTWGATAKTIPAAGDLWSTHVRVDMVTYHADYWVEYAPPRETLANTHEYARLKELAIKQWLHELTNCVRKFNLEPPVPWEQRDRASDIKDALASAVARPVISAPKARPEDAFVARVLARRKS